MYFSVEIQISVSGTWGGWGAYLIFLAWGKGWVGAGLIQRGPLFKDGR